MRRERGGGRRDKGLERGERNGGGRGGGGGESGEEVEEFRNGEEIADAVEEGGVIGGGRDGKGRGGRRRKKREHVLLENLNQGFHGFD